MVRVAVKIVIPSCVNTNQISTFCLHQSWDGNKIVQECKRSD